MGLGSGRANEMIHNETFILRSEHSRILAATQERCDEKLEGRYWRGVWDGLAWGLITGVPAGVVLVVAVISCV